MNIETDFAAAANVLGELAEEAPNDDVREALNLIAPIFEQLSTVDQSDSVAMQKIFEMMSSPKVNAASEVFDRYVTDVCGFGNDMSETTTP